MQAFDYDGVTRQRYQDAARARRYHTRFAAGGLKHARGRFVARQERRTLRRLLASRQPGVVLDVPCGTGKMATVFAELGATVVCADISAQMIEIAKDEYERLGHRAVEFVVCDAESVSSALRGRPIDVACCIRLLHRTPAEVRQRILGELAKTAPMAVVSYGVTSPVHRLRGTLLRKKGALADSVTRRQAEAELREHFSVLRAQPIARGLCSEWFFLAEARTPQGPGAPPAASAEPSPDGP